MEKSNKNKLTDAVMDAQNKIEQNENIAAAVEDKPKSKAWIVLVLTILMLVSTGLMTYRLYDIYNVEMPTEEEMLMSGKATLYFSALDIENFRDREERLPAAAETEIVSEYVQYSVLDNEHYLLKVIMHDTILEYNSSKDEFPEMPF